MNKEKYKVKSSIQLADFNTKEVFEDAEKKLKKIRKIKRVGATKGGVWIVIKQIKS